MIELSLFFFSALIASLALTPICRLCATRAGVVANPREDRWHGRPTALFGGVAIVLPVLAAGLTLQHDAALWQLFWAGVLISVFGFVDDSLSLKASTKLILQVLVAAGLLFFGWRLHWVESMIGDAMLTLFWIVGVTNAFNLLDNMDGLCAGTALIAGTILLIDIVTGGGVTPIGVYLAALIGATAGFLVYNLHPASIFMGDTGSLFIGLNLAALTLVAAPGSSGSPGLLSVVAVPVLPLLIPIFDTTLVTALRLLSGRSVSQGGRDHTSHRLVAIGLSEPRAVATLWMLTAFGGAAALLLRRLDPGLAMAGTLLVTIAMVIFGVFLARVRVYEDADLAIAGRTAVTPVIADFMFKRRVAEILLDLFLIPLAYYGAYRLRFEGGAYTANYVTFIQSMPIVLATQLLALFVVGAYRGTWLHFGLMDAVVFAKGVLLGTVGAIVIILFAYRFANYSRAVFVIDAALLMLALVGSRASFRLVGEFIMRRRSVGQRCVVYGVGGATLATIREAFGASMVPKIIGFVDDDATKKRTRVGGYSVLGGYMDLLAMVQRRAIDCVVLNTHLVDVERLRELERACHDHEVELLRLHVDLKPVKPISAAS
jgi:UDP-GlcNAc:undecaprenyl-phosphate GlcNAc-1-phosphate transferase